jgi:hypothetical protein
VSVAADRGSLVPAWIVAHRGAIVWLVIAALTAMAVFSVMLGFAARPGAQPFEPQHPVVFIGSVAVIAAYGFMFALLVRRQGENVVGWIFGAFALVLSISNLTWAYLTYATETIPPQLPGVEAALLIGVALVPWWTFLLVALIVAFPDGRPFTKAWAWLIVAAGVLSLVGSLAIVFGSGPLPVWMATSPLGLPGPSGESMAVAGRVSVSVLVLMALAGVWSLTLRYRAADDIGRLQLKWFVYAGGVFVACGLLFWIWGAAAYVPGSGASTAAWLVLCLGAIVMPIAASIAILRYHLYDIETIIGRTLVYGGLTAILAGLYTAGIRLFNALFVEVTGESSDAALVLTTLVLATTFTPIKAWLEGKVASRKGIIADPDRPVAESSELEADAGGELLVDDATVDRIAERAAAIVLERLAETGWPTVGSRPATPGAPTSQSAPSPQPGRATLE